MAPGSRSSPHRSARRASRTPRSVASRSTATRATRRRPTIATSTAWSTCSTAPDSRTTTSRTCGWSTRRRARRAGWSPAPRPRARSHGRPMARGSRSRRTATETTTSTADPTCSSSMSRAGDVTAITGGPDSMFFVPAWTPDGSIDRGRSADAIRARTTTRTSGASPPTVRTHGATAGRTCSPAAISCPRRG